MSAALRGLLAACLALTFVAVAGTVARAEIAVLSEAEISPRDLQCMALNIYWEAGHGSELELRAVAHVTINRAADPAFPSGVCDVVTQGGERPINGCQFQWWCDGRSDQPTDMMVWRKALGVAEEVLGGHDADPTDGALFFHNTSVRPSWAGRLQPTVRIGNQIFYQ